MKVYIAGPISGKDAQWVYDRFRAEEERLKAMGHEPVNPILGPPPWTETREYCMRRSIVLLLTCDGLSALSGWGESRGAKLEVEIARQLGLWVIG